MGKFSCTKSIFFRFYILCENFSKIGPIIKKNPKFQSYPLNDIDTGITSRISKFADDTKLCKCVDKPELRLQLQEDINKLPEWSDRWMMPFNTSKCSHAFWVPQS